MRDLNITEASNFIIFGLYFLHHLLQMFWLQAAHFKRTFSSEES